MSPLPAAPPSLLDEYSALVADTLTLLNSWQQTGHRTLMDGSPPGLEPYAEPPAARPGAPAPDHRPPPAPNPAPALNPAPDHRPPPAPKPALNPAPYAAPPAPAWGARTAPAAPSSNYVPPPPRAAPVVARAAWSPAAVSEPIPAQAPAVSPVTAPVAAARPADPSISAAWSKRLHPGDALAAVREDIGDCRRCGRCNVRSRMIYGVGSAKARLVVISGALTAEEEAAGTPFVGEDAEMFDKMLEKVLLMERADAWLLPVLMCRGALAPQQHEITACRPLLLKQIDVIRPRCVLLMGAEAMMLMPGCARGTWGRLSGIATLPTWHPRELRQEPAQKAETFRHLRDLHAMLQKA